MKLDLAHVRRIQAENGRLLARIEELEHEVRMLKQLAEEPDEWSLPDAPPGLWLPPAERSVLWRLFKSNGTTVHKIGLLEHLYSTEPDIDRGDQKIIDVYICKIRRKLRGCPWVIKTRWGVGYYLVRSEPEAAAS